MADWAVECRVLALDEWAVESGKSVWPAISRPYTCPEAHFEVFAHPLPLCICFLLSSLPLSVRSRTFNARVWSSIF